MTDQKESDYDMRDALPGVDRIFVERWSPRAFQPGTLDDEIVARLIDAARWSPSCFNEQPWRFCTSTADTFGEYLSLLVDSNQAWARNASVLGYLVGSSHFAANDKPNDVYALDCGAAWMAMTLQARREGLYTHGMAGIKREEVSAYLGLDPDREVVLMGFAIGRRGDKAALDPKLQEREAPSPRKPLGEIWNRGR
ncbi:MAG: nitroreductase family protein [Halioglobus sp.]|jgi:nitroreductase